MRNILAIFAFIPSLAIADMIGIKPVDSDPAPKASVPALLHRPKTAVNMLEPWHENRPPRDTEWEDQLTFSEGPIQSVEDLRKLLMENSWRTIYHCDGRPADDVRGIYNGLTLPYTYGEYGHNTVERRYAYDLKSPNAALYKEKSYSVQYELKQLGENKFEIIYLNKKTKSRKLQLVKVDQTHEWAIRVDGDDADCQDGTKLGVLWAPFQTMN